MDGIFYESGVVKRYEFDEPLIHKLYSILDSCYRGCNNIYYHTFVYIYIFMYVCIYDIELKNIRNIEMVILTSGDKSMTSYELNEKLEIARRKVLNLIN